MLEELGLDVEVASAGFEAWRVEMLAGDAEAAEQELRRAYDLLVEIGEKYFLSTVAGFLAQTLYALGRFDEVNTLGRLSQELAIEDDVDSQAVWRCALAKVRAREGSVAEGEVLVREALEILAPTDAVLLRFGALLDLAEVLRLAGRSDVEDVLAEARALAETKRSPVLAAIVEAALAASTHGHLVS
jgi:ATP/maltotriose-dependent transcriptional regulator MalT